MSNSSVIEPDGSLLPSDLSIINDERLGLVISIKDYHGNTTSFITDYNTLEALIVKSKSNASIVQW